MKTARKLFAIVLAVMLLATTLMVPVMAEDYTVTVEGTATGHTYEAYQIFAGGLSGMILTDIEWGTGVNGAALLADLKSDTSFEVSGVNLFAAATDAKGVADVLEKSFTSRDFLDVFAKVVAKHLTSTFTASSAAGTNYTIDNLAPGYYMVKDMDNSIPGTATDAYTKYIIEVVQDVTVSPKSAVPELTKTVSRQETAGFAEGISSAIGDTVYFRLEGTMPERISDYAKYYYVFTDILPEGVTYTADSVKVSIVNGTESADVANTEYTVNYDDASRTLTVTFADVKAAIKNATHTDALVDDVVRVVYASTLNTSATIGSTGNKNKATLTFSNNPNVTDHTANTGVTPENQAIVYTYQLTMDKVDGNDTTKKLKGAIFQLYRIGGDGTKYYAQVNGSGILTGFTTDASLASSLTTDTNGAFNVKGLSSGTYHLVETKAPDGGYNKLADEIKLTITATADASTGALTTFNGSVVGVGSAASDLPTGNVTLTVKNNLGTTLPETGGIGTTIFYVAGIVLVAAALTLVIMKKRTAEK